MNPRSIFVAMAVTTTLFGAASADSKTNTNRLFTNGAIIKAGETAIPASFFETMMGAMTGAWEGQYTDGTFSQPTDWEPVRVEYRVTSRGTALVEDYYFGDASTASMTTVYHVDNDDVRLTHYCGARNHPSMIATEFDPTANSIAFDFTGITNLETPESYHSRRMEVQIVSDDHIKIQYHGLEDGSVASQAYDFKRVNVDAR